MNWMMQIEKLIQEKHMLSHTFYRAWTEGRLTKETLQLYAKEYYHHVKAFPTYISALHSRCHDPRVRKALLANLIDEEAGNPNHPDLWRDFALALGVREEELESHCMQEATQELINHFKESCQSKSLSSGVAALYSYEAQIPSICQTKIEGLKKWYGLVQPESYRYFSEHESMDVAHSQEERELLLNLVRPEEEESVLQNVQKTLDVLWNFLSSFKIEPCIICN